MTAIVLDRIRVFCEKFLQFFKLFRLNNTIGKNFVNCPINTIKRVITLECEMFFHPAA